MVPVTSGKSGELSTYFLAGVLGIGAFATGRRLLDREGSKRRQLWQRARENARENRIGALQMKRTAENLAAR
jgi:hypothetical protein